LVLDRAWSELEVRASQVDDRSSYKALPNDNFNFVVSLADDGTDPTKTGTRGDALGNIRKAWAGYLVRGQPLARAAVPAGLVWRPQNCSGGCKIFALQFFLFLLTPRFLACASCVLSRGAFLGTLFGVPKHQGHCAPCRFAPQFVGHKIPPCTVSTIVAPLILCTCSSTFGVA